MIVLKSKAKNYLFRPVINGYVCIEIQNWQFGRPKDFKVIKQNHIKRLLFADNFALEVLWISKTKVLCLRSKNFSS